MPDRVNSIFPTYRLSSSTDARGLIDSHMNMYRGKVWTLFLFIIISWRIFNRHGLHQTASTNFIKVDVRGL